MHVQIIHFTLAESPDSLSSYTFDGRYVVGSCPRSTCLKPLGLALLSSDQQITRSMGPGFPSAPNITSLNGPTTQPSTATGPILVPSRGGNSSHEACISILSPYRDLYSKMYAFKVHPIEPLRRKPIHLTRVPFYLFIFLN